LQFLSRLKEGTPVALLILGDDLTVVSDFTTSSISLSKLAEGGFERRAGGFGPPLTSRKTGNPVFAGRKDARVAASVVHRETPGWRESLATHNLQADLRLSTEAYQTAVSPGVPLATDLKLDMSARKVRVMVRDENSGKIGAVDVPVDATLSRQLRVAVNALHGKRRQTHGNVLRSAVVWR
jgi:hypothetical protein